MVANANGWVGGQTAGGQAYGLNVITGQSWVSTTPVTITGINSAGHGAGQRDGAVLIVNGNLSWIPGHLDAGGAWAIDDNDNVVGRTMSQGFLYTGATGALSIQSTFDVLTLDPACGQPMIGWNAALGLDALIGGTWQDLSFGDTALGTIYGGLSLVTDGAAYGLFDPLWGTNVRMLPTLSGTPVGIGLNATGPYIAIDPGNGYVGQYTFGGLGLPDPQSSGVPEPGTLLLMFGGLLGILACGRRR